MQSVIKDRHFSAIVQLWQRNLAGWHSWPLWTPTMLENLNFKNPRLRMAVILNKKLCYCKLKAPRDALYKC